MFLRVPCHFTDLGLCDVTRIDARDRLAHLVHCEHQVKGFILAFVEELHQDENHVLHRCVVIVMKDDLVPTRNVRLLSLFKLGIAAMPRRARGGLRCAHVRGGTLWGRNAYGRIRFVSVTLNHRTLNGISGRRSTKPPGQVS